MNQGKFSVRRTKGLYLFFSLLALHQGTFGMQRSMIRPFAFLGSMTPQMSRFYHSPLALTAQEVTSQAIQGKSDGLQSPALASIEAVMAQSPGLRPFGDEAWAAKSAVAKSARKKRPTSPLQLNPENIKFMKKMLANPALQKQYLGSIKNAKAKKRMIKLFELASKYVIIVPPVGKDSTSVAAGSVAEAFSLLSSQDRLLDFSPSPVVVDELTVFSGMSISQKIPGMSLLTPEMEIYLATPGLVKSLYSSKPEEAKVNTKVDYVVDLLDKEGVFQRIGYSGSSPDSKKYKKDLVQRWSELITYPEISSVSYLKENYSKTIDKAFSRAVTEIAHKGLMPDKATQESLFELFVKEANNYQSLDQKLTSDAGFREFLKLYVDGKFQLAMNRGVINLKLVRMSENNYVTKFSEKFAGGSSQAMFIYMAFAGAYLFDQSDTAENIKQRLQASYLAMCHAMQDTTIILNIDAVKAFAQLAWLAVESKKETLSADSTIDPKSIETAEATKAVIEKILNTPADFIEGLVAVDKMVEKAIQEMLQQDQAINFLNLQFGSTLDTFVGGVEALASNKESFSSIKANPLASCTLFARLVEIPLAAMIIKKEDLLSATLLQAAASLAAAAGSARSISDKTSSGSLVAGQSSRAAAIWSSTAGLQGAKQGLSSVLNVKCASHFDLAKQLLLSQQTNVPQALLYLKDAIEVQRALIGAVGGQIVGMADESAKTEEALAVLGLPAGATTGEVKDAYKKLALAHHPDKNSAGAAMFKELVPAYRWLTKETSQGGSVPALLLDQRDAETMAASILVDFEKEVEKQLRGLAQVAHAMQHIPAGDKKAIGVELKAMAQESSDESAIIMVRASAQTLREEIKAMNLQGKQISSANLDQLLTKLGFTQGSSLSLNGQSYLQGYLTILAAEPVAIPAQPQVIPSAVSQPDAIKVLELISAVS